MSSFNGKVLNSKSDMLLKVSIQNPTRCKNSKSKLCLKLLIKSMLKKAQNCEMRPFEPVKGMIK